MAEKVTDFGRCVTNFLTTNLVAEKGCSQRTVQSYATALKGLVAHASAAGMKPERIRLADMDAAMVRSFLDALEESGCSPSTRNQRLSAIKAFVRYAVSENPHYMLEGQRILSISSKRCPTREVEYLERDALAALLAAPDLHTASGRREAACMALLYDSGARVQELIDLKIEGARLEAPASVTLTGKGSKTRTVPITRATASLVLAHLGDRGLPSPRSASGLSLVAPPGRTSYTRPGIAKMLSRNLEKARAANPAMKIPASIHPHMLRATKAIHLLDSGVDIILIRDLLGHVSISTTQVYLRVNTAAKLKAIEEASPSVLSEPAPKWREDAGLMSFLREMSAS